MYPEIKRAVTQLLDVKSSNRHESALIGWVDLLTGKTPFDQKVSRVINGEDEGEHHSLLCIWDRYKNEEDVLACSRLIASMVVAHTHHAGEFLDKIESGLSAPSGLDKVWIRHAAILGVMKAVSVLHRISQDNLYGFWLEHPIKFIPHWVVTYLDEELRSSTANEQSTLITEFVSIYSKKGLLEKFGEALRDAEDEYPRIDCPGQTQFVNTYSYQRLKLFDSGMKLNRLHPKKKAPVADCDSRAVTGEQPEYMI